MADYIRFDWAMKRLLRDKANFAVIEGLLTTLLNGKITICKLLESESNQEDEDNKYNRVDILAEDSKGRLLLFEIQNNNEFAYFQRMLFGVSKLVTEYIRRGQGYENIRKIYSINIVYFSLGAGTDYVYHGTTEFRGIHNNDVLKLSPFQRAKFEVDSVSQLYPEYFILRVNDFNKWSRVPLEQWIYFLNTGEIPDDADAPGLSEAREHLKLASLSKEELAACIDACVPTQDEIYNTRYEMNRIAERYDDAFAEDLKQIESKLKDQKMDNLQNYRAEIENLITADIVLRHNYQEGVVEYNLTKDSTVMKAVELLRDKERYTKILQEQDTEKN